MKVDVQLQERMRQLDERISDCLLEFAGKGASYGELFSVMASVMQRWAAYQIKNDECKRCGCGKPCDVTGYCVDCFGG